MLYKVALLIVSTSSSVFSQDVNFEYQNDQNLKSLGVGLIQQAKISEKVQFYKDSSFKEPLTTNLKLGNEVVPLLYKPDYGICFYVCTRASSKFLRLETKAGQKLFVKPSTSILFYSWNDFLTQQVVGIRSKNATSNPLRYSINGKVINTSNWSDDDEESVVEVKGDWLKIKNQTRKIVYWIRWKEKNKLLVYLNMLL